VKDKRGYFGIVMYNPKTKNNWGSLMRTAHILGADFMATIGARFPIQSSDVTKSYRHIPIYQYSSIDDLMNNLPYGCQVIGIEMGEDAQDLKEFSHPHRACYILGSEDNGLPPKVLDRCHHIVRLKGERSLNVSIAGSIVIYDRVG